MTTSIMLNTSSSHHGHMTTMTSLQIQTRVQQPTTEPVQNIATVNAVMSWIYVTLGIVGVTANCCVVIVILQSRQLRRQLHNIFLLNQCFADFWCSAFVIASVFKNSTVRLEGIVGEVACRIWLTNLLPWIGFNASLYNLVALSVERYFEIVHPIKHKTVFDRPKAIGILVLVWVSGAVWQSAAYIPHSAVINGTCYVQAFWDDTPRKVYGLLNFAQKMAIPVLVFIWCYGAMARSLRVIRVNPAAGATSASIQTTSSVLMSHSRARRNIFKMLLYVTIVHVISWSTNQVVFVAYAFGYPLNFTSLLYQASIVLIYGSVSVNPFVYVLKYERFRKILLQLIIGKCRRMPIVRVFTIRATND